MNAKRERSALLPLGFEIAGATRANGNGRTDATIRARLMSAVCFLAISPAGMAMAQEAAEPAELPPVKVETTVKKAKSKPKAQAITPQPVQAPAPEPVSQQPSEGEPRGAGTVSDIGEGEYKADALTSPLFSQPLLDTPRSIQVVPEAIIKEQRADSFSDVLRNVPGITLQTGEGNPPGGNQLKLRGFSATGDIYMDGLRDPGFQFRDTFNTEGVEVIKGPGSAEFGRGSTGGAINLVTKKPRDKNFVEVDATAGDGIDASDPTIRTTIDVNQKLDGLDGAIRINGLVYDRGVPGRDFVDEQRIGFAPSVTLGLNAPTSLNLSYQYTNEDKLPDAGIPLGRVPTLAFPGQAPPVDFSNFYGYLNRDYYDADNHVVTTTLKHEFSKSLEIDTRLRYSNLHVDSVTSSPRIRPNVGGVPQARGESKPRDQVDEIIISQTNVTSRFNTAGAKHTVVAGLELANESAENKRRLDTAGPTYPLFNPDPTLIAPQANYNGTRARIESDTIAVYLRDTIELSPQWILSGGVRFDHVETDVRGFDPLAVGYGINTITTASGPRSSLGASREDDEVSWNLGLTWKPLTFGSFYVAYGTAFEPVGSLGAAGAGNYQLAGGNNNGPVEAGFFADPEKSESYEIGTKWDLLDRRLSLTGAVFRIDKTNARNVTDIGGGIRVVTVDGEQRVDGFELGATGQITPAWKIFAGYTYLDSEILESDDPARPEGAEIDNIPRHTFSLWTAYTLPFGLEIAGGAYYVDERTTLGAGTPTGNIPVTVDDYWRFDAAASYPLNETWTAQLNLRNLTNERYIESLQQGGGQGVPGESFSALFTLNAKFGDK